MDEGVDTIVETVVIPLAQFFPLIKDVSDVLLKVVDLYKTAEHNKKITGLLMERIVAANTAVSGLQKDLHTQSQYDNLKRFVNILKKMQKYSEEITQYNKLQKFLGSKSIESTYKGLCKEYDSGIILLNLNIMVNFKVNAERDNQILNEEMKELTKFQAALGESIENVADKVNAVDQKLDKLKLDKIDKLDKLDKIDKLDKLDKLDNLDIMVDKMNKIVEQASKTSIQIRDIEKNSRSEKEAQEEIDNIFQESPLPFEDYEETKISRGDRLKKYIHIKFKEDYAFKTVDEAHVNQVKNQVTILKQIQGCQNVIKFYGFTKDSGDTHYLVTEWAEYGNLSEYIKDHGQNFDIELKLRFAYDIAKGLNFLNATKIVHRDIRSENIVITEHKIAKITNFKLSRGFDAATGNLAVSKESVRHNSPEMIRRGMLGTDKDKKKKYDTKCEVYSFGILLWEIAECRSAYEKFEDFMEITNKVLEGYREPFTEGTGIPKKYQELVNDAVDQIPNNRPTFANTLATIQDIYKKYINEPHKDRSNSVDSNVSRSNSLDTNKPKPPTPVRSNSILVVNWDSFDNMNEMTLEEAVKEHNNKSSTMDKTELYKCFDTYANMGMAEAKYYKAYFITKGWYPQDDKDKIEADKDKLVAELYKEAADYGDEFPDAQLRYALVIMKKKGPMKEAVEYLEKAAKNGSVMAMFNVSNYYFKSGNKELGKNYMVMAAKKKYPEAIKFCETNKIPLD